MRWGRDRPRVRALEGHMADPDEGSALTEDGGAGDDGARVQELTLRSTGRWLVATRGSVHVFDLDASTWCRIPRYGRGAFPYDGKTVVLSRVEVWPRVGCMFLIRFDDIDFPTLVERWHRSSIVTAITRLTG